MKTGTDNCDAAAAHHRTVEYGFNGSSSSCRAERVGELLLCVLSLCFTINAINTHPP